MPIVYPARYFKPAPSPVLDVVGTAAAAYGLRKMRAAYAGSCIRVRRSSDNTQADIGFDSTGALDTAALLAHTGSSSGYVVTWYDQSGNGVNATQSTAANQPRIVNSGVVDTSGNQPGIYFDGSAYYFTLTSHIIKNAPGVTCMAVTRPAVTTGNRPLLYASKNTSAGLDRFWFGHRNNATDGGWLARDDANASATWINVNGGDWLANEAQLMCGWWDATNGVAKIFRNQVQKYSASVGTSGTIDADSSQVTTLGRGQGSDGTLYFNGTIYSMIVYLRALTDVERRDASEGIIRIYGALRTVITRGDSILAGTAGPSPPAAAERLVPRTKARIPRPQDYDFMDRAYSGATVAQMQSLDPASWLTYRHIPLRNATVVYGTGRNDMSVDLITPAECLTRLQSYYQFLKVNGYSRVIYCTCIADGTQSIHDNNRALRDLVLASPKTVADAICDWGALPEFDEKADADNTTYYQTDKIHPTAAGTDKLAIALALVV